MTFEKITDFYGSQCGITGPYYINNCDYNQAHDILQHLYPEDNILKPTKGAASTGQVNDFILFCEIKNMGERFLQKTGTSTSPLYPRVPLAIQIPYYN